MESKNHIKINKNLIVSRRHTFVSTFCVTQGFHEEVIKKKMKIKLCYRWRNLLPQNFIRCYDATYTNYVTLNVIIVFNTFSNNLMYVKNIHVDKFSMVSYVSEDLYPIYTVLKDPAGSHVSTCSQLQAWYTMLDQHSTATLEPAAHPENSR